MFDFKNLKNSENNGMEFERLINDSNNYYKVNNLAFINKIPTPINVVKLHGKKITEAYFYQKSTTDYNGIYNGNHIDFEAKCTLDQSLNLSSNLHHHQREHLINIHHAGGVSFLFVWFKSFNRFFILFTEQLLTLTSTILSIHFFEENCIEIIEKINPSLDYLKVIDQHLEGNKHGQK